MASETATNGLNAYLLSLIRRLISLKIVGLFAFPSYQRLMSESTDPQLQAQLRIGEAEIALSARPPATCSACKRPVRLQELASLCIHISNCKSCVAEGNSCSKCLNPLFSSSTTSVKFEDSCQECQHTSRLEDLGFLRKIHRECFVKILEREVHFPMIINRIEVPDSTVLRLLSQRADLLKAYKKLCGILLPYSCPYSSHVGEVDISEPEMKCASCGLDMLTLKHTVWDLALYRSIRQAVQGYIEAETQVMQCPYCFSPARFSREVDSYTCLVCSGRYYACCCCKTLPVLVHGNRFHRPECSRFDVRDYREERCEICPKKGPHSMPTRLKVPRRFDMTEMAEG